MNINDEFILSYYQELSQVNEHISLVQHIENKRIYLKKTHALCDKKLYEKLAQLDLEHIPKFYHIIEDAQALIIIEEYISGASLEEILKKEKQLPLSKVLDILVQLCTILAPLHQASPPIIHRDIKPSNILITPKGRVKLIDFNASKEFDPEKTSDTVLMGTVGYAAPEQYGYFQSDARTDIYSLGVLMNKLLTGELPRDQRYEGEGAGILNRAINLAPENRFPDVLALRGALLQIASPKPKMVSAPPVEPIQQSKKVPPPPIEDAQQEEPRIYRPKPKNTQQKYPKLPPGFRRLKPLNMIFASFLYLSILGAGMTLTLDDPTAPLANVYIERVGFLLFWFTMIAYYGNYLGLRNRLFLHNQPSKGKPILAYIFWTFALSSIIFIPMMILQNIIAGR